MKTEPKDPRSTGRKRGRAALEAQGRPYWCRSVMDEDLDQWPDGFKTEKIKGLTAGCGRSPKDPEAPGGYYPAMSELQVNHINKDVLDNDPVNLDWVCPSCHKVIDSQTEKGVSTRTTDEWGYGPITGTGNAEYVLSDIPGITIVPDELEESP